MEFKYGMAANNKENTVGTNDGTRHETRRFLPSLAGAALARFIKLVGATSSHRFDPPDLAAHLNEHHPCIFAIWHGQFMMMPMVNKARVPIRIMVAKHGDAEIIGQAITRFDMDLIRGAGAGTRKRDRGGAQALRASVTTLRENYSLAMTADVPPGPARVAGMGIITLARMSGKPIIPVGIASSRYLALKTWSRFTINLPFSRMGITLGDPIYVPRKATDDELEVARQQLERAINETTAKAYELARANPARATPPRGALQSSSAKPGFRLRTYKALTSLARPLLPSVLGYRERRNKEDPARRSERFGLASKARPEGPLIWAHAASVGELNAILPLLDALTTDRPDLFFLVTTGTLTSARQAAERLGNNAIHQFLPYDTVEFTKRFLDYWHPDLTIFTESEIWPNLILGCIDRQIPLVLVNGRLSLKSFNRWRRNASMAQTLFGGFELVLAQNTKLAHRFSDLGARDVVATGNLKIDAPALAVDQTAFAQMQSSIGDRPLLVAASTHEGEDEIIAAAHDLLKRDHDDFLTIIAPRHPERASKIMQMANARGLNVARRSTGDALQPNTDIYLADTIGELGTLYKLADIAFIGGSLIEHGGQNPIEAIRHGASVLTGPHWGNFRDEYKALIKQKAVSEVTSSKELADAVASLLRERGELTARLDRARSALDEMSGALQRTLKALLPMLPAPAQDAASLLNEQQPDNPQSTGPGRQRDETGQDASQPSGNGSSQKDILRAT